MHAAQHGPGLLVQVTAPARRLLSWRHKIKAKAVDIYFGRRRVIHANNWLVKVRSLFMTGSCLVHHAAARGLHDTLLESSLSLVIQLPPYCLHVAFE